MKRSPLMDILGKERSGIFHFVLKTNVICDVERASRPCVRPDTKAVMSDLLLLSFTTWKHE